MRLDITISTLLISLCLPFPLVPALPSLAKRASLYDLLSRRTPYSVVPVDGGAADIGGDFNNNNNGEGNPGSPNQIPNFTTIPIAATQTSVETDIVTLPPVTNYLTLTTIIEGPTITQVTEVTLTPAASQVTITRTSYSIINISSPTQYSTSTSDITSGVVPEPTDSTMLPSSFMSPAPDSTRLPGIDPSAPRMTIPTSSTANATHSRPSGPTSSLHLYFTPIYPSNSSSMAYSQTRNLVMSTMTARVSAMPSP